MKNEKFCFSKGTGLIALVGIVLVGLVIVMTNLPSTSTSTRASGNCFYSYSGTRYEIPDGTCVKDTITTWNTSLKCVQGAVSAKTTDCAPAAGSATCWYGGNDVSADAATGAAGSTGCISSVPGYKCRVTSAGALVAGKNSAVKDTLTCPPTPAAGSATCWYGGNDVSADAATGAAGSTGCISSVPGYKCRVTSAGALVAGKNSAVKDTLTCPPTPAAGSATCWYGGNDVSADAATGAAGSTGCISSVPGYKCRVTSAGALVAGKNSAVKDTLTCPPTPAAGICLYGGQNVANSGIYDITIEGCVLQANAALGGYQKTGYKCRLTETASGVNFVAGRNSAVKDSAGTCRKQCSDTNCGAVAYSLCGTGHQMCKCSDATSFTEVAGLVYDSAGCP